MNRRTQRTGLGVGAAVAVAVAMTACSGQPGDPPLHDDPIGTTSAALSGNDAVARALLWVQAEVPYCQSPNGQPDPDTSCASVCSRPTMAQWDPYRSDCSGFVSWAWDLPAPGRTTSEFAPAETDITEVIDGTSLMPGDALNIPGDHIVMFVAWVTQGQSAVFYEEPGCSANPPYAHQFTSNVEISGSSVTIDYEGSTFTAIRYTGLSGTVSSGAPDAGATGPTGGDDAGAMSCFVSTLNLSGTCMLTTDCASMGGTSTPGFCPGANDIQCCTSFTESEQDSGVPPTSTEDSGLPPPPPPVTDSGTTGTGTGPGTGTEVDSGEPGGPGPKTTEDAGTESDSGAGKPGPKDGEPTPPELAGNKGCSVTSSAAGSSALATSWPWLLGVVGVVLQRRKRR